MNRLSGTCLQNHLPVHTFSEFGNKPQGVTPSLHPSAGREQENQGPAGGPLQAHPLAWVDWERSMNKHDLKMKAVFFLLVLLCSIGYVFTLPTNSAVTHVKASVLTSPQCWTCHHILISTSLTLLTEPDCSPLIFCLSLFPLPSSYHASISTSTWASAFQNLWPHPLSLCDFL